MGLGFGSVGVHDFGVAVKELEGTDHHPESIGKRNWRRCYMGVSQNWGIPIIRTIAFWGLYWGPPILGNYHIAVI